MQKGSGYKFMQSTRYEEMDSPDQQKGLPSPPLMAMLGEVTAKIELPDPDQFELLDSDFQNLVGKRRSRRRFKGKEALSLAELGYLLRSTQGVQEVEGRMSSLRTVPSAGARHALETLILVRRVDDLETGLYQYDAFSHRLLQLPADADCAEKITEGSHGQDCVAGGAVVLLWIAVPYRMSWRYGERAYRYLHLDAGHVCQNLYLAVEAMGLGTVAVAAFDDDEMNKACGVDGAERFVIYLAPVGKI